MLEVKSCSATRVEVEAVVISDPSTATLAKTIRTKVAILGAGISGIGAAKTLALKYKVSDMVQGLGKNLIWTLAEEVGLKSVYINYSDVAYYNEKGKADFSKEAAEFEEKFAAISTLAGERQFKPRTVKHSWI
ncbi:hypothetical protein BC936DRAFT_144251 [Jimgerdemannia flammicorona]|uniref:Uncharacterized protein n=1 Tax=Jimgerdemannia flammicorona TaxID=994334 RepID=A0A433DCR2_9FUNG|nr:hypothetical protein BC936DRAFT_144251 [Jimgerdemannia flammicorona]